MTSVKTRKLAEHYNVLFFDQRGVGRSSAVTRENVANIDPKNYGTPENVEDIADLVSRVVKKKRHWTKPAPQAKRELVTPSCKSYILGTMFISA